MQKRKSPQSGPLLKVLEAAYPEFKRTKLKQLLKYGAVTVDGTVTRRFDDAVRSGQELGLMPKGIGASQSKFPLRFPIVYEDESLIVIDKPEGLLTMGTEEEKRKTAYWKIGEYLKAKGVADKSVFIVHRLDRDASGLVVFAKNEKVKRKLQDNWDAAEKKYYAVVEGGPEEDEGVSESYLAENKFKKVYSTREGAGGKKAVTRWRVVARKGAYALVDVALLTGRKHQIRVHMSDLGCPIIGDERYGAESDPAKRLGLHAAYLSFPHPVTGKRLEFKSDLPAVFKELLHRAGRAPRGPKAGATPRTNTARTRE